MSGYIKESERSMERWYGENFAHLVPNEPQPLVPTDLDCDHEHWRICVRCGRDDGAIDDE